MVTTGGRNNFPGSVFLGLATALLPSLAGCGSDGFTLAPVSGKVTIDGQPVAGVRIAFEPIGGADRPIPGPESIAITDAEGRYRLYTTDTERRGAVVGPCRVRIWTIPSSERDVVFDDRDPNYDSIAEVKAIRAQMKGSKAAVNRPSGRLPLRFNDQTELSFTVPPEGTDKADFQVTWK